MSFCEVYSRLIQCCDKLTTPGYEWRPSSVASSKSAGGGLTRLPRGGEGHEDRTRRRRALELVCLPPQPTKKFGGAPDGVRGEPRPPIDAFLACLKHTEHRIKAQFFVKDHPSEGELGFSGGTVPLPPLATGLAKRGLNRDLICLSPGTARMTLACYGLTLFQGERSHRHSELCDRIMPRKTSRLN